MEKAECFYCQYKKPWLDCRNKIIMLCNNESCEYYGAKIEKVIPDIKRKGCKGFEINIFSREEGSGKNGSQK